MEYEKVGKIIEYFGYASIDDATIRLSEALLHFKQERIDSDRLDDIPPDGISDAVFKRISNGNYRRPVVHCAHFSYLLRDIGEHFAHTCEIRGCNPDYLHGNSHCLVYDSTANQYRDPSIYKTVFNGIKWVSVEESGLDRNNLPEEILHLKPK